jgi:hypothetical protein
MTTDAILALFEQHVSAHPWAQVAFYGVVLIIAATLAQWLASRVLGRLAFRVLVLSGNAEWDAALVRRRVYRRLGYAVWLAVFTIGIREIPHLGRSADAIERLAHAGSVDRRVPRDAGSAILAAWQDVYANDASEAQTRSIKGYMQVTASSALDRWSAACSVLSILIERSPLWMLVRAWARCRRCCCWCSRTRCCRWSRARSSRRTTCCASATGSRCRKSNADGYRDRHRAAHRQGAELGQHGDDGADLQAVFGELPELPADVRVGRDGASSARCAWTRPACASCPTRKSRSADALPAACASTWSRSWPRSSRCEPATWARARERAGRTGRRLTNIGTFRAYGLAYLQSADPEMQAGHG